MCSRRWFLTVLDRAVAWGFACISEQLLLVSVSFGKKGIVSEQTDLGYFTTVKQKYLLLLWSHMEVYRRVKSLASLPKVFLCIQMKHL